MGKKLDTRLMTVAQQIRSKTHADIGSDHGGRKPMPISDRITAVCWSG